MDQADGVYAHYPTSRTPGLTQRPWELTSQTLSQYRVEDELKQLPWQPPVPSQEHDPLAGAATPIMEMKNQPNTKSLNRAFNGGMKSGSGNLMPHTIMQADYMVPPKFGWRTEELGIDDIMRGVMTKIADPQNPANSGYMDDYTGQKGGYTGGPDMTHNSMEIPQGL